MISSGDLFQGSKVSKQQEATSLTAVAAFRSMLSAPPISKSIPSTKKSGKTFLSCG